MFGGQVGEEYVAFIDYFMFWSIFFILSWLWYVILDRQIHLQVVLDLDETLVCAYETSSLPTSLRTQATEAGLNWFELECVSSDKVHLY